MIRVISNTIILRLFEYAMNGEMHQINDGVMMDFELLHSYV